MRFLQTLTWAGVPACVVQKRGMNARSIYQYNQCFTVNSIYLYHILRHATHWLLMGVIVRL